MQDAERDDRNRERKRGPKPAPTLFLNAGAIESNRTDAQNHEGKIRNLHGGAASGSFAGGKGGRTKARPRAKTFSRPAGGTCSAFALVQRRPPLWLFSDAAAPETPIVKRHD